MNRIHIPTSSAEDWRKLLAKPEVQWRSGYSARELAECWEGADGFPVDFHELFSRSGNQVFHGLEMLLAIPEYKVPLPDGKRPSQNDLFVLARTKSGPLVTMMIEGKAAEPFADTLEVWLRDASEGRKNRLKILCEILNLKKQPPMHLRYQLFHRTASAILEAKRFNAQYALMIVHSFSPVQAWFADYLNFLGLFGTTGKINELVELPEIDGTRIFTGWVDGHH